MKNSPRGRRKYPAFTLLEVLVSIAVLCVIVVIMAAMASQASRIWIETESKNQKRSTGRALLQFIARDLEMAVVPNLYPPRTNAPANLQFTASLPSVIPSSLLNPHAAFWQAPVAADRSRGELAEVGYFVRWDTTSQPGTAKAQLCRFAVDPSDTANYLIYASKADGSAADWLAAAKIDEVAPATAAENYRGWFADNVIAIWFRCLDREGKPILKTASGTVLNGGYGFDSQQGYESPSTGSKQKAPALPASIDVVLVTVDSRTARKITAPITAVTNSPENFGKDANIPGSLAHFLASLPAQIKPGVQVFSTRVRLKNSGN